MAVSVVIGQPDFTTVTSGSGNNMISIPDGFILDIAGNLFIADSGNNRTLQFNAPLTTGMAASVVIGQPDFVTITPGFNSTKLGTYSEGIVLDSAGNLLVTDEQNNRILTFSNTRTGGVSDLFCGKTIDQFFHYWNRKQ